MRAAAIRTVGVAHAGVGIEHEDDERADVADEDLGPSPMPSHRMAIGIQAMGGIGRRTSKTGLTTLSKVRFQPMYMPSGSPVAAPSR